MTKGWLNDDFDVPGDLSVTGDITNSPIRLISGYVENLGVTYSAGTFTIQGANATLSASNPGYVCLPSSSAPGTLILYTLTADQNFIDDAGSSEILDNLFGQITSVATTNPIIFTIMAVGNNAESAISFMLTRDHLARVSPVSTDIGAPDDAVADSLSSFWSFDNLDETLYDANPCIPVGTIPMTMTTSDDWTVGTLTEQNGIGKFVVAGEWVPLAKMTTSTTATADFKLGTAFDQYKIELSEIISSSDGVGLNVLTSTDGGANFDAGASDYMYGYSLYSGGSITSAEDLAHTDVITGVSMNNNTTEGGTNGTLLIHNPNTTTYTKVGFTGKQIKGNAARPTGVNTTGARLSAADVDGIRFIPSTGSFASGDFTLYGKKDL